MYTTDESMTYRPPPLAWLLAALLWVGIAAVSIGATSGTRGEAAAAAVVDCGR